MDSALLKNFLVLAKAKNMTKAARQLHRSQSALSLQIQRLEEWVGKPLFHRTKRGVELTQEGVEFVGYAQRFLKQEEEMLAHFRQPDLRGEISIGTPEDLATAYLPPILSAFVEAHPAILLTVDCQLTVHLLQGFSEGVYDLILVKQDPRFRHPLTREVWKEPLAWVCKKGSYPLLSAHRGALPLIVAPPPCVYRERALQALKEQGIASRIVYTSPSLTGAVAAVQAGLGIAVLPLNRIPQGLQPIKALPPLPPAEIALLTRQPTSEATTALAAYVIDHMQSPSND
jgi:DNA-binding transcriptional LysR family regulator